MESVINFKEEWVIEHVKNFLEAETMFFSIDFVLFLIPFKAAMSNCLSHLGLSNSKLKLYVQNVNQKIWCGLSRFTGWGATTDKHALVLESLRVLRKGGVFAINDEMRANLYGDVEDFARELRAMGFVDVRLVDTAQEALGSHRMAVLMLLGHSWLARGRN